MTDERLSCLAILHIHKHKDAIDIDGIIAEFARLKGTRLELSGHLPVTSLMASLFYPFLP